jgi:hypothetical protein
MRIVRKERKTVNSELLNSSLMTHHSLLHPPSNDLENH